MYADVKFAENIASGMAWGYPDMWHKLRFNSVDSSDQITLWLVDSILHPFESLN